MTPGPRARARRRRLAATVVESAEPATLEEAPVFAEPEFASDATIIDTTATVISEDVQPITLEPVPAGERTDFYFPPLPRTDQHTAGAPDSGSPAGPRARRAAGAQAAMQGGPGGLARALRRLVALCAQGFRRLILPALRVIWHWIVDDPYAPPRERPGQDLLQGHVLGVYRYRLYQRIILGILGGVPLSLSWLYILYTLATELRYGIDGRLFLAQDLAGAIAGLFGSLMILSLASTCVTLHSDGVEYRTMFRVVSSRWEEIGMVKVDYFRHSERWVVGTGRGAWAFLYRSLFGLPKGRQLAKLITIYARLSPTGTPYWLPSVGRFTERQTESHSTPKPSKEGTPEQAP